jgi:hypothetical protein
MVITSLNEPEEFMQMFHLGRARELSQQKAKMMKKAFAVAAIV